jgi:hypothetical protein
VYVFALLTNLEDSHMLWLRSVNDEQAEGYAKEVFEQYKTNSGAVPNLHRVLAIRPAVLKGRETMRMAITGGATTLGRRREELLNFFGATAGGCTG